MNGPVNITPTLEALRPYSRNDPLTAKRFNDHLGQTNKLTSATMPQQVTENGTGVSVASIATGLFSFQGPGDPDTIMARRVDADGGVGDEVTIALPYGLRQTPFDGQTIGGFRYAYSVWFQRISTQVSFFNQETQRITPRYLSEVWFRAWMVGNTGISGVPWEADYDRHWAKL